MIQSQTVLFGEWLPDQDALGNPQTYVVNAIPQAQTYSACPGLDIGSDAITSQAYAAYWTFDASGDWHMFSGCATKLYKLNVDTWTDVSQAGDYTVSNWVFIKWGSARVIAIGDGDVPQYYDLGTSTDFADLSGAPTATCGAVVGDFIVLGGASSDPTLVKWSGYNSSTLWTPSLSTQSDEQQLLGTGPTIKAIVPQGNSGVIFCDRSIRVMTYVGPPIIFRFDIVEEDRGVLAKNSVTWSGATMWYYGLDGFYEFTIGSGSRQIGNEKVDRFFRNDADFARVDEIRAAVDRKNQMVCWTYPSVSTGTFRMICYRHQLGKWTIIDAGFETIFDYTGGTVPILLEDLDSYFSDMSAMNVSVDSDTLITGTTSLAGFTTAHKMASLSSWSSPLPAEMITGEIGTPNGKRLSVKSVRPLIDADDPSLYIGTRDNQNDYVSYSSEITQNAIGEFDARTSARYHRFKMTMTDNFLHAKGVEVFFRPEGRR